MEYFCGIDGGATKTTCVITDENLNSMASLKGAASSFLKDGELRVASIIVDLIRKSLKIANIKPASLTGVVVGSTGAGREKDALRLSNKIKEAFKNNGLNYLNFKVVSDAQIALEGAFGGEPGAILIAGTGSIMYAKNKLDEIKRVGGFGRLIGDEGGGNKIGLRGLIGCAKAFDNRGINTLLIQKLKNHFNIYSAPALIDFVYNKNFPVANFAPYVIEAAAEGDKLSITILEEEANELILHIKAMLKLLGVTNLNIAPIGSLITRDNYYSELFRKKVLNLKGIKIVEAKYPPEIGAVILAKKLFSRNKSGIS